MALENWDDSYSVSIQAFDEQHIRESDRQYSGFLRACGVR